jgi:hypothetical protein
VQVLVESVPIHQTSVHSSRTIFGDLYVGCLISQDPDGSVGSVRETVGKAGFYNPRDGGISV